MHEFSSQCSLDLFSLIFLIVTIINKSKSGYCEPPVPLSLSFTNNRGLRGNFSHVEFFLANSSPDPLAICETTLGPSISSSDFDITDYLPLNRKNLQFICMVLASIFVTAFLLVVNGILNPLTKLTYAHVYHFCNQLVIFSLLIALHHRNLVINSISENIDKALLTHPSANISVFGDFNIHHMEWLPFSHTTFLSGITLITLLFHTVLLSLSTLQLAFWSRWSGTFVARSLSSIKPQHL